MKGWLLPVVLLLSACASLPTTPLPPPGCHFPDGTHFVFIGVASGPTLGLTSAMPQPARWWVSSERVSQNWRPRLPGHGPIPPARQACGVFGDGNVESVDVPPDWHPPFSVRA